MVDKQLNEEPSQVYENQNVMVAAAPQQPPVPNYQNWKQDPKLLTKSTLDGGDVADRGKFLPNIAGGEHPS